MKKQSFRPETKGSFRHKIVREFKEKISKFRKLTSTTAIFVYAVCLFTFALFHFSPPSEQSIRSRIVVLQGPYGLCSGSQIHYHNRDFILTASHCEGLKDEYGSILASVDGNHPVPRKILEVSPTTDLMLLEPLPDLKGLEIADDFEMHESVKVFGHGLGLATHIGSGELIQPMHVVIPLFQIVTDDDKDKCASKPKFEVATTEDGDVCAMKVDGVVTNAMVMPGDSGAPMVDDAGKVTAVVFAGDGRIGLAIPLNQIQDFLSSH